MFFASAASQTQMHSFLHGIYVILKGKYADFTVLQGVFTFVLQICLCVCSRIHCINWDVKNSHSRCLLELILLKLKSDPLDAHC